MLRKKSTIIHSSLDMVDQLQATNGGKKTPLSHCYSPMLLYTRDIFQRQPRTRYEKIRPLYTVSEKVTDLLIRSLQLVNFPQHFNGFHVRVLLF